MMFPQPSMLLWAGLEQDFWSQRCVLLGCLYLGTEIFRQRDQLIKLEEFQVLPLDLDPQLLAEVIESVVGKIVCGLICPPFKPPPN